MADSSVSGFRTKAIVLADLLAVVFALVFVRSVISNSLDLIRTGVKNAPASYALIAVFILTGCSYIARRRLLLANIVSLTIIGTSAAIWLFGIHR